MDAQRSDSRTRLTLGLGILAAILALSGIVAALAHDDGPAATDGTTTTTAEATGTTAETTTTTAPFEGVNPDLAVFPDPTTSRRFDDPVALVTSFTSDLVGFSEPLVGELVQGDGRSGEIEVRPFVNGPPTLVLVRQLEDDSWFVIAATTDSIELTTPASGDTITSPQRLDGMGYAFEGTINVRLFVDGTQAPITETVVTGRGDGVLGDFTGRLQFTNAAGATHGVLVLSSEGGADGAPIVAAAVRVRL